MKGTSPQVIYSLMMTNKTNSSNKDSSLNSSEKMVESRGGNAELGSRNLRETDFGDGRPARWI